MLQPVHTLAEAKPSTSPAAIEKAKRLWRSSPETADWLLVDAVNRELTSGRFKTPVLHRTAVEALALSRNPNVSLTRIEQLVDASTALAAKVISLANCPLYRGRDPFYSVRAALVRVGMQNIRDVLAQAVLASQVFDVPQFQSRIVELSQEASGVAFTSSALAAEAGVGDEYAFMAGLLHDLGKGIVLQIMARYAEGLTAPADVLDRIVEAEHCRAGLYAAQKMSLPGPIARAISRHHDASLETEEDGPAVLVSLARRIWLQEAGSTEQDWPEVEALTLIAFQIGVVTSRVEAARPRLLALGQRV